MANTITNKHNLPQTLVNLAESRNYSRGKSDRSITQLIDSPQISILRMANENSLNINIKGYYCPDKHGICGTVEEVQKELNLEVCDIVNLIKSN